MAERELPWLREAAAGFVQRLGAERVPHALLITGPDGVGKSALAYRFARILLCEAAELSARPCGACRGCRQLAQETHADFQRVAVEDNRRSILVQQIRDLTAFLALRSQYDGYRVGLIDPADAMNTAAANSLLKTLEEPPEKAVLILVASAPHRLPATVRSRCQRIHIPVPPRAQALDWLQAQGEDAALLGLAGGAPLRAAELNAAGYAKLQDELVQTLEALRAGRLGAVEAAQTWLAHGKEAFIALLLTLIADLIRLATLGQGGAYRDERRLQALAKGLDLIALHQYLDHLLEARRHQDHPLNEQLVLEDLLIGWRRLAAGQAANRRQ